MEQMTDWALLTLIRQSVDSPALMVLFDRYRPILLHLQQQYFIPGHDSEDWEQEALLVFCRATLTFSPRRSPNFGAFYRLILSHRVFDLIRQSQAQKRQAAGPEVSLEDHREYLADTVPDHRLAVREQLEIKEALRVFPGRLSRVEKAVFAGLMRGETPAIIGVQEQMNRQQVTAAVHRCQVKLRELLAE